MAKITYSRRTARGFSITELVMSCFVFAFSVAVIGELSVVSTMSTMRTTNKADCVAQARNAVNRISENVRNAGFLGDFYGVDSEKLNFPSSTNAVYRGGRSPSGGWPSAPWPSTIVLSGSTLIVQTPVTYLDPSNDQTSSSYSSSAPENSANGIPLIIPKDNFNTSDPPYNLLNFDTTVYTLVPDPTKAGEFLLQVARFPGAQINSWSADLSQPAPSYKASINPPQTLLKGIVGPKPAGAPPEEIPTVFSYFKRQQKQVNVNTDVFTKVSPSASNIDDLQGVAIDIEVQTTGTSSTAKNSSTVQNAAIHEESYLKSNRKPSLRNNGANL